MQMPDIIIWMLAHTGLLLTLMAVCSCVVDRTYYTYLGLDITASPDEISAAYLTKKDKLAAIDEEETRNNKSKLLEEAYGVLSNTEKRSLYDRLNRELLRKESVVSNLKKLSDKSSRKAKPILFTLPVSTEDVYHGKIIQATFLKHAACQKCKGTGAESPKFLNPCPKCGAAGFSVFEGVNQFGQKFANQNTCQVCQGSGKQVTKICPVCSGKKIQTRLEKVKIRVPKGLPDGNVIRVSNFGDEPVLGAPSDLQVTIVEIPTQKWSREGENLVHYVPISLKEAIFGFSKTIEHLSGEEIHVARKEVTTGLTTITLPNQGIENLKTGNHGKLTLKFKIMMPKFTDKQLDLWEQFFRKHNL